MKKQQILPRERWNISFSCLRSVSQALRICGVSHRWYTSNFTLFNSLNALFSIYTFHLTPLFVFKSFSHFWPPNHFSISSCDFSTLVFPNSSYINGSWFKVNSLLYGRRCIAREKEGSGREWEYSKGKRREPAVASYPSLTQWPYQVE